MLADLVTTDLKPQTDVKLTSISYLLVIRSLVHWFIRLFFHLFIRSFVCSLARRSGVLPATAGC